MKKNHLIKSGAALVASLLFFKTMSAQALKPGMWRGVLALNDSTELPFNFKVVKDSQPLRIEIINADERIAVDEIRIVKDSLFMRMPVFDSEFRCIIAGDSLKGLWINHSRQEKTEIPFRASYNDYKRFEVVPTKSLKKTERYKAIFEPGTNDEYNAIGIFRIENGIAKGTFSTETGDYRYLEGYAAYGKFMVSCFDGAHAFLFTGKLAGDSITGGHFYSGLHGHENWVAMRNDTFQLRNPDSLTYLKPGYSRLSFSFKNTEGRTVSLDDAKYKGKVVIVQLMGTWCPNCMDETQFLASFYEKYKSEGLEVIGLAFERTNDFNKAADNILRTKKRFHAQYEFLVTMKTGATQASEALPMLNKVMAFPTTIYIDKKGLVRKIYTGFYGPATGAYHDQYVDETTRFVEKLLSE